MKKFTVMVSADYVDGCTSSTHPEGEFGGDGYIEYKNSLPLCLGIYQGENENQAVNFAASG